MSIAGARRKFLRWPLLLFLIAFVIVMIFVVGHTRSGDEPRAAVTRTAEAPSAHSESRVIASVAGTAIVPSSASVAFQKAGPPDPIAERTAAESAARSAGAAADLAGSTPIN